MSRTSETTPALLMAAMMRAFLAAHALQRSGSDGTVSRIGLRQVLHLHSGACGGGGGGGACAHFGHRVGNSEGAARNRCDIML